MAKFKIKHTITKKEWNKKHKDFKTTIDGVPYIMMYSDKDGTYLAPVKIVEATDAEEQEFHSKLDKLVHKTFGKSPEEEEIEEAKGGDLKNAKNRLKDPHTIEDIEYSKTRSGDKFVKIIYKKKYVTGKMMDTGPHFVSVFYNDEKDLQNIGKALKLKLKESVNEAKRGEFEVGDFVHFKSANKTGLVRGIKGDKVTILTMKGNYTGDIKDIKVLHQDGVNEMNINDPILMKLRALQMKKNKEAAKKIDTEKQNKNAIKIKALKKKRAEVMRDMEQEAEPEGGKIADRYGKLLNKIDNDIIKLGGNPMSESVNENDGVYFKSYTAAIEAARAAALKKGFEVEEDEMFTKVGMNSKRPSVGKTTKVSLELIKNGKPQRKMLHIQVYGMKNGYELNSYIN